jgi:hypothetical protein
VLLEPYKIIIFQATLVWTMTIVKYRISIVFGPGFPVIFHGGCEMELAGKTAYVTHISKELCDERSLFGPRFGAVFTCFDCTGVHAGQETGPAGSANW